MTALSFLFVPYSTAGHVHPMLPVMAELVATGAVVRAVVGTRFAAAVRTTGAAVTVLDAVPDVFVPDGLSGAARFVVGRARRPFRNARAADRLDWELRHRRPDLVVLDPMLGWADRVARRARVRSALFSTTFADSPEVRAAIGRRPGRRARQPGRLVLAHTLPDLQPAVESLPSSVRLVAPLIRPDDPEAVFTQPGPTAGTRLLYVSPGTVFGRTPRFFRTVGDAFAGRPWRVVMATGPVDPGRLGPMPANVRVAREVPQPLILRSCDVFLTHGGMNSALEGLSAGVPMALSPRSAEQRFIADRLVRLGVGGHLGTTPARLYADITRLADDPAVRAAALAWRHRLAGSHGAGRAAALLTAEAGRGNPTGRAG